jgi:C_GCAxxG_C_C family probable redox protein
MLTKETIFDQFTQSIHCSQLVAGEMADKLGYDRELMMRLAAPFGGGMFCGETCGAVAGGIMAIGMKYGHCKPRDTAQNELCVKKTGEFLARFTELHGATRCRDILGYDLSEEGALQKAFAAGRIKEVCPGFVLDALEILDDIIDE